MVVIEEALVGRMTLGRYVQADLGYLGCQDSVTSQVIQHCNRESPEQCEVGPQDFERPAIPCPSDLKIYMEVQYYCGETRMSSAGPMNLWWALMVLPIFPVLLW